MDPPTPKRGYTFGSCEHLMKVSIRSGTLFHLGQDPVGHLGSSIYTVVESIYDGVYRCIYVLMQETICHKNLHVALSPTVLLLAFVALKWSTIANFPQPSWRNLARFFS